jgi:hypothetical protein
MISFLHQRRTAAFMAAALFVAPAAAQDDVPGLTDAEVDGRLLAEAANACKSGYFSGFWEAFVQSVEVRSRYTAAQVRYGDQGRSSAMARTDYAEARHFPVALWDYAWVAAESINRDDDGQPDFLELVINQSSRNQARVDWVRRTGGNFEGLDAPESYTTFGQPGYLLFYPTETCWELVEDIRLPAADDSQQSTDAPDDAP